MNYNLQHLINLLSQVDIEMATRPGKHFAVEIADSIFGERKQAKRENAERKRALQNKKCMIINSYPIPTNDQDLINFANLAFSSYNTTEVEMERSAWKNKLYIIMNRLKALVNANQGEKIAEEYLFLSAELEKIEQKENKPKKGFFRF